MVSFQVQVSSEEVQITRQVEVWLKVRSCANFAVSWSVGGQFKNMGTLKSDNYAEINVVYNNKVFPVETSTAADPVDAVATDVISHLTNLDLPTTFESCLWGHEHREGGREGRIRRWTDLQTSQDWGLRGAVVNFLTRNFISLYRS